MWATRSVCVKTETRSCQSSRSSSRRVEARTSSIVWFRSVRNASSSMRSALSAEVSSDQPTVL